MTRDQLVVALHQNREAVALFRRAAMLQDLDAETKAVAQQAMPVGRAAGKELQEGGGGMARFDDRLAARCHA